MRQFISLLLFQFLFAGPVFAQHDTSSTPADSLHTSRPNFRVTDSLNQKINRRLPDSISQGKPAGLAVDSPMKQSLSDTAWIRVANKYPEKGFIRYATEQNKFFGFSSLPIRITSNKKEFEGKELLFYSLIALLLLFAFIRFSFPKYFIDLFRVAFRTTLKQRQIGEQLVQTPIPSLLLNFFFFISAGLYINFLLQHYYRASNQNFWLLYFYCCLALAIIYIIKFLSLKFSGWLFNISTTTDAYIFIVFMINKIIGIFLLPFLVLLAFTDNNIYQVAIALSYAGVFGLLGYRFILSYGLIRSQMRLNPFHFFLYLCAFEIVPLILIYKALLIWF